MSQIGLETGSRAFQKMILSKLEWRFALLFGPYGTLEMILSSTNQKIPFLAGYLYGYPLDPYMVLSPAKEAVGVDGFWVQPFRDGSTGLTQPVRMAVA
jgi:hypothetical protein